MKNRRNEMRLLLGIGFCLVISGACEDRSAVALEGVCRQHMAANASEIGEIPISMDCGCWSRATKTAATANPAYNEALKAFLDGSQNPLALSPEQKSAMAELGEIATRECARLK